MHPLAPAGQTAELATTTTRLHYWQVATIVLGITTILSFRAYAKLSKRYKSQRKELQRHQGVQSVLRGWIA